MDIKKIYGKMPGFIKDFVGTAGRIRLIHNKVFKKQYQELMDFEKLSSEEKKALQFKRLKAILVYAYKNIPYYNRTFKEKNIKLSQIKTFDDISRLPLLKKDDIRCNENELCSRTIKSFYKTTSGGTTGTPISMCFDYGSLYKERAFVYYYWSKYGYDYKRSKLISFRDVEFDGKLYKKNTIYNEMIFNPFLMSSKTIEDICVRINRIKEGFLYGYPSVISSFCKLLQFHHLDLKTKIQGVFLISENLYKDQELIIRDTFNCPIAMFYGHTEKSVFAEREGGIYRFNPLYGYTEIMKNDGDNIVCTGFINKKMPLIRYCVDDRADECEDGYQIIGHKQNEKLYGFNNAEISATAIEFVHDSGFEKVVAYQFVQREIGRVTLNVVVDKELSVDELNTMRKSIRAKLPSFEISIKFVDTLEKTNRGKHRMIVQYLSI